MPAVDVCGGRAPSSDWRRPRKARSKASVVVSAMSFTSTTSSLLRLAPSSRLQDAPLPPPARWWTPSTPHTCPRLSVSSLFSSWALYSRPLVLLVLLLLLGLVLVVVVLLLLLLLPPPAPPPAPPLLLLLLVYLLLVLLPSFFLFLFLCLLIFLVLFFLFFFLFFFFFFFFFFCFFFFSFLFLFCSFFFFLSFFLFIFFLFFPPSSCPSSSAYSSSSSFSSCSSCSAVVFKAHPYLLPPSWWRPLYRNRTMTLLPSVVIAVIAAAAAAAAVIKLMLVPTRQSASWQDRAVATWTFMVPAIISLSTTSLLPAALRPYNGLFTTELLLTAVGCVAQRLNIGLWPANFPCPALDLQLTGNHLCG